MSAPGCRCPARSEHGRERSSTTSAPGTYLVDTNVLVYAYDGGEPEKQERAREALERLEASRLGVLSTQVLGEFFNIVTRRLARPLDAEEAERSVRRFARSWTVLGTTMVTVFEAIRGAHSYRLPYYDGLIWATARLSDISQVLSEDFGSDQVIEGVRFVNPFSTRFDLSELG